MLVLYGRASDFSTEVLVALLLSLAQYLSDLFLGLLKRVQ
jgi:hypothetical protein